MEIKSKMPESEINRLMSMAFRSLRKGFTESDVSMAIFSEIHRYHDMTKDFQVISNIKSDTRMILSKAKGEG